MLALESDFGDRFPDAGDTAVVGMVEWETRRFAAQLRSYYKSSYVKQYEKGNLLLRTETCLNDTYHSPQQPVASIICTESSVRPG